jgi:succinyl-CoA synthetase beta subunit
MKQYKVTFTYRGYVAGVFYNKSNSASEAIASAKLHMSNKWTRVNAILVVDETQENWAA